jgi:hypothetical protein
MAVIRYADDWKGTTPYAWHLPSDPVYPNMQGPWYDPDGSGPAGGVWREHIIPYTRSTTGRAILRCPVKTANLGGGVDRGHYGISSVLMHYERVKLDEPLGFLNLYSEVPMPSKTILIAENWDGDWAAEPDNNNPFGQAGRFWPYHSSEGIKGGDFIFCDGHAKWMSVRQTEAKNTYWYWWRIKPTLSPPE